MTMYPYPSTLSFFPYNFLKFSKFLKTYCYKFELLFICLSLKETNSLLFTFALKKLYFPIFRTNYFINIYPYSRALANLWTQYENKLKQFSYISHFHNFLKL